jgi:hypothetical protein
LTAEHDAVSAGAEGFPETPPILRAARSERSLYERSHRSNQERLRWSTSIWWARSVNL